MANGAGGEPSNISCFIYGPGDARYEEHPMPTITDPYDVLVRIHYVGVCGSDVRIEPPYKPEICPS
jgi:threonine dehydrogenase-like Zn-dependent dehydrogenase